MGFRSINHQPSTHFFCYDGNGNVIALVSAADGSVTAQYEYDAFGGTVRETGPMAEANPMGFSSQYTDKVTRHLHYLYRVYVTDWGRWPSRDPIGEPGFDGNRHFAFSKEDIQRLATIDPEGENPEMVEAAQNNIFYTAGKLSYVMVDNNPINEIDLYGLVCSTVVNRTKALMSSGINAGHEWIEYGGSSVGFWPNKGYIVLRPDPGQTTPFPVSWQWDTEKKKSGTIKWGAAAGKSCECATCDDILASLAAAPNPGWHSFSIRNNCRRFAEWALDGSCLKKGKKTSF